MNMQLIGIGNGAADQNGRPARALRSMSREQFLNLGVHQVAYVRAGSSERGPTFQIFGADGVPLAAVEGLEEAVYMAVEQGFEFVTVH